MSARVLFMTPMRIGKLRLPQVGQFHRTGVSLNRKQVSTKAVLRPNIAVVGGGHAGISAALRLASLPWSRLTKPQITLIDKSDRFCFLPMLYELALGQVEKWEIAPKFEYVLQDTPIQFVQGEVDTVDTAKKVIEGKKKTEDLTTSFQVPFDRAVLALGAQVALISSVPGAEQHAQPFYTLADALRLKAKLRELKAQTSPSRVINIVVVGGGYSGVEIASCLADDFGTSGSVMIVETSDRILGKGSDFNRESAKKALSLNGAAIQYDSRVTKVTEDEVTVERKTQNETDSFVYPADLVIWTAGSAPNAVLERFGLPLDEKGRMATDSFLQVKDNVDVLCALGDAAAVAKDSGYYGTAQVAVQQAEYAAWNTWASLTGKPKLEYRYAHLGEMMVLGSNNATVTTSLGLEIEGTTAWASRRVAYLARMPTSKHRSRVAASWAVNPLLSSIEDLVKESRKHSM